MVAGGAIPKESDGEKRGAEDGAAGGQGGRDAPDDAAVETGGKPESFLDACGAVANLFERMGRANVEPHRRGDFDAINFGLSHGQGQKVRAEREPPGDR